MSTDPRAAAAAGAGIVQDAAVELAAESAVLEPAAAVAHAAEAVVLTPPPYQTHPSDSVSSVKNIKGIVKVMPSCFKASQLHLSIVRP